MIEACVIAALFIYGVDLAMDEREILGWVRKLWNYLVLDPLSATRHNYQEKWNEKKFRRAHWMYGFALTISKPLLMCPVCMSSLWGGTIFTIFYGVSCHVIIAIPVIAAMVKILINLEPIETIHQTFTKN